MKKQVKIVLADDNKSEMDILEAALTECGHKVLGKATNGNSLLEMITDQVEVVICDVLLSGRDGFSVMEECAKAGFTPKFIITSVLYSQTFIAKAQSLGAAYYMIKPIDAKSLANRVDDLFESFSPNLASQYNAYSAEVTNRNKQLEERITNIFITVGIPAHIKGYQFLREAIKMAIKNPEIINSITKELYPSIASKFDTSASKVERAIRHAIEVAWNRGKIENINNVFGIKVYSNNEKPTNGEFIALVADKMLLEG